MKDKRAGHHKRGDLECQLGNSQLFTGIETGTSEIANNNSAYSPPTL